MTQTVRTKQTGRPRTAKPLRMTYEEFLNWLDEDKHAEWVNGEVMWMSPVTRLHQVVARFLLRLISEFVERKDLGTIFYDPFQMKIGPDFPGRAPDILFVANANVARIKALVLEGPADLVVEVVSPSTRGVDRGDKHYEYERGGVKEYWLIDPERKLAEFYLLGEEGTYSLAPIGEDGLFRSVALEGLWLRVAWLWQDPPPAIRDVLMEWRLD